jgi:hypothetical protein
MIFDGCHGEKVDSHMSLENSLKSFFGYIRNLSDYIEKILDLIRNQKASEFRLRDYSEGLGRDTWERLP